MIMFWEQIFGVIEDEKSRFEIIWWPIMCQGKIIK